MSICEESNWEEMKCMFGLAVARIDSNKINFDRIDFG